MAVSSLGEQTILDEADELAIVSRRTPLRLFWYRFVRNKPGLLGAAIILLMILAALLAPLIAPFDPNHSDFNSLTANPSRAHLLGTDDLGRDTLSRIIFGARTSTLASIIPVLIALGIGVPLGLIAGYYRGFIDDVVIMRVVDAFQAFPFLILALALASVLGPGFVNAMIAIGIGFIPAFIRIVRGQVLAVGAQEYISAAHAMGVSDARIMRTHILPNAMGPLLVQTSVAMAAAVLAEAALAFLGLSVQPPTASWGVMLSIAQGYVNSDTSLALWPGIAIFLAVLGFNLLGDGIREGLDPRLSR